MTQVYLIDAEVIQSKGCDIKIPENRSLVPKKFNHSEYDLIVVPINAGKQSLYAKEYVSVFE